LLVGKAEEIREDQRKANEARAQIVGGLRERRDVREITTEVAAAFGVDETKAYRWVMYAEQEYERSRRRVAATGLSLLWVGVLLAAAGVLLHVFEVGPLGRPLLPGLAAGLPLSLAGLLVALLARRIAR
jgi:hypothetical protein